MGSEEAGGWDSRAGKVIDLKPLSFSSSLVTITLTLTHGGADRMVGVSGDWWDRQGLWRQVGQPLQWWLGSWKRGSVGGRGSAVETVRDRPPSKGDRGQWQKQRGSGHKKIAKRDQHSKRVP